MQPITFQFVEGEPIESVEQFLAHVRGFGGTNTFCVYLRGEPKHSPKLLPSIGRPHFYAGRTMTFSAAQEQRMLNRFRRYAYSHFQRVPTDWETLFLARHHGLPTRLLDWTSNPLVALYFAAFHENDEVTYGGGAEQVADVKLNLDGVVWAILQRDTDESGVDVFSSASPLSVRGIKFVQPFYPSPRMVAQSGVFTLHGEPWKDVVECAGKEHDPSELDIVKLIRWRVSSRCKPQLITELERMSVNSRTLFPDLDGLAKGLWQAELIREPLSNES